MYLIIYTYPEWNSMLFADGMCQNASVLMGALKMLLECVHVHYYTCMN